jgi:hypothetical protein
MEYHYNNIIYTVFCEGKKGPVIGNNMLDPWRKGDKFTFSINSKITSIHDNQTICGYYPIYIYYIIIDNIKNKTLKIDEDETSYKISVLIKGYFDQEEDYYIDFSIDK